ncbi:MAG: rod shape-determining protein MreD, partial [Pseudomonadota bacterium]
MANSVLRSRMVIGVSFFVALVLQTIPWPGVLDLLRPSWLFL